MNEVKIIDHALERAAQRGAAVNEVRETIRNGESSKAKYDRIIFTKVFEYNDYWKRQFYKQKMVKVICVKEKGTFVVITVKVFFGEWR
jgi:ribosomal protein S18 acetylase RimI-like enzyme